MELHNFPRRTHRMTRLFHPGSLAVTLRYARPGSERVVHPLMMVAPSSTLSSPLFPAAHGAAMVTASLANLRTCPRLDHSADPRRGAAGRGASHLLEPPGAGTASGSCAENFTEN